MAVYKRGKNWWYKFNWNGEPIRESTKQTNKRTAEQMEATHKTSLAKGEVGLRDRKPAPTLKEFAERDFLLFARSTFAAKLKTLSYYENGIKSLLAFEKLASARLDTITGETIAAFIAHRQDAGLKVSSINRELQALRRMFHLAQEWSAVEKALPAVKMVPGELHRERVLTAAEEDLFFRGAGTGAMEQHADPRLLADVARILLDCALRPEECFRLRRKNVTDASVEIHFGKTDNARRRIPMTPNVQAIIDMRLSKAAGREWVFPAPTMSGHIEPSSLKKQHAKATSEATRRRALRNYRSCYIETCQASRAPPRNRSRDPLRGQSLPTWSRSAMRSSLPRRQPREYAARSVFLCRATSGGTVPCRRRSTSGRSMDPVANCSKLRALVTWRASSLNWRAGGYSSDETTWVRTKNRAYSQVEGADRLLRYGITPGKVAS